MAQSLLLAVTPYTRSLQLEVLYHILVHFLLSILWLRVAVAVVHRLAVVVAQVVLEPLLVLLSHQDQQSQSQLVEVVPPQPHIREVVQEQIAFLVPSHQRVEAAEAVTLRAAASAQAQTVVLAVAVDLLVLLDMRQELEQPVKVMTEEPESHLEAVVAVVVRAPQEQQVSVRAEVTAEMVPHLLSAAHL